MAFKTPGVYVQEISVFPPSVAEVATAIPAFVGYTEQATLRGEDLTNKPTKISSLLEYRELFGGAFEPSTIDVGVDKDNNFAVTSVASRRYYLFESVRLYFDNGGGDCYIVSVGPYIDQDNKVELGDASDPAAKPGLLVGLKAVEKVDEPTILLAPDGCLLAKESELFAWQQQALRQSGRLQDRVGVFDLYEKDVTDVRGLEGRVDAFRSGVGINQLKYGAAYTPWLQTSYPRTVAFSLFKGSVKAGATTLDLAKDLTSDPELNALVTAAETTLADQATLKSDVDTLRATAPSLRDRYKELRAAIKSSNDDAQNKAAFAALLALPRAVTDEAASWRTGLTGANLLLDLEAYAGTSLAAAAGPLVALEKNTDVLANSDLADAAAVNGAYDDLHATGWLDVDATAASTVDYYDAATTTVVFDQLSKSNADGRSILGDLDAYFMSSAEGNLLGFIDQITEAAATHAAMAQQTLYQGHTTIGNIVEHIKRDLARVPPSGAVAGVYAFVDRTRGVWKAPANVSLSSVLGPAIALDDADQEDLNVDAQAGKSINAIRAFTGKGTIVWGARTLAGNDNEWRYVPVRRFFNLVEESVKKSTSWAVFEPNAAPLWTKVKGMIDNYLNQKWREGALAGATPQEAFFVKVGLGTTMTQQDILEGRLNVEIGMAVVRPAEFIILKFSHKMQES